MAILNLGSCAIDHVYRVPHFVQPGETLPSASYEIHPGGKGLNQSIAIARAGAGVRHAGRIGKDGEWLKQYLEEAGVDTSLLQVVDSFSGHAIIEVNDVGENAIILFGGTNRQLTPEDIRAVISTGNKGDTLLLQNEISGISVAMDEAFERGLKIVFNAAPMTTEVLQYPLEKVSVLIVNEVEGQALSGQTDPLQIVDALSATYPDLDIVLTLGKDGAVYQGLEGGFSVEAPVAEVVDSTGAGDTFTGYLVAGLDRQLPMLEAITQACRAAAVSVTRPGAASSIPAITELG